LCTTCKMPSAPTYCAQRVKCLQHLHIVHNV